MEGQREASREDEEEQGTNEEAPVNKQQVLKIKIEATTRLRKRPVEVIILNIFTFYIVSESFAFVLTAEHWLNQSC